MAFVKLARECSACRLSAWHLPHSGLLCTLTPLAPPCRSSSSRRPLPLPASPPVHPGSLTLLRILNPERALLPFSAWRRLRHFPECLMPTRLHATPHSRIGTSLSDCSSAASLSFLQKTACQPCQSLALRKPDALTLSAA